MGVCACCRSGGQILQKGKNQGLVWRGTIRCRCCDPVCLQNAKRHSRLFVRDQVDVSGKGEMMIIFFEFFFSQSNSILHLDLIEIREGVSRRSLLTSHSRCVLSLNTIPYYRRVPGVTSHMFFVNIIQEKGARHRSTDNAFAACVLHLNLIGRT